MRALLALAITAAALTAPHVEVTLKIAMDRNGAVDDLGDKAERFTSPASLDAVHRLRRHCDAVLVGASTVARDDPSLTVRRVRSRRGRRSRCASCWAVRPPTRAC
jgi:riboflavin biosynthesis pyrimidine reductase